MRSLLLLPAFLLPCAAAAAVVVDPPRVVTEEGPWGDYEAFPDVCRLRNGEIFVVFYGGRDHITLPSPAVPKGGAVYAIRSRDDGKNWSAPELVADTPKDDRDPHVAQLRDGSLLCTFFTYEPKTVNGVRVEEGDLYVTRSRDRGRTWSAPEVVPTSFKKEGVHGVFESGSPVQLKGSHVVLPIYFEKTKGHYVTAVVHSTDGGRTWGEASLVDPEQSLAFSYGFCEASIARVPDGRLITVMRPGMHQAYSSDEGYTWTEATKLPVPGDAPGLLLTSRKELVVTFRYQGTSAMVSRDGGATWSEPVRIDTVEGAYSNQVELPDGSLLCIYYEEGPRSNIRAANLRIPRAAASGEAPSITWREGAPPPRAKAGQAVGWRGAEIVCAGGTWWEGPRKLYTDEAHAYDPAKDRWRPLPPYPAPLAYAAVATYGKDLIVAGGWTGEKALLTTYRLRPGRASRWERLPDLPAPRVFPAAAVVGSHLYVLAGARDFEMTGGPLTEVVRLDLRNPERGWETRAPLPGPGRCILSAAAAGGKIYLFGGYSAPGKDPPALRQVLGYDPAADRWSNRSELPVTLYAAAASCPDGRRIYLFGGVDTDRKAPPDAGHPYPFEQRTWVYDTVEDTFAAAAPLPRPVAPDAALSNGKRFYVLGGEVAFHVRSPWTFIGEAAGRENR